MSYKDPLIRIIVIADATEVVLETHTYAYPNLMALIADRLYPDNFGECKGRGQCGTCHIHMLNNADEFSDKTGNENTTLDKIPSAKSNSRLACQIIVNHKLHGVKVEVIRDYE